jgi:putative ABC transport system permease protein
MERLMTRQHRDEALAELHDLWHHVATVHGPEQADRRYLRELRRYPARLLARRLTAARAPELAGAFGALARHTRRLARAPVLTASIVLTVALGLGGSIAMFAVADLLILRPLPYQQADRLVWIHTESGPYRFNFSVVDFQALAEEQTSFERVAALQSGAAAFVTADGAERVSTWRVTPGLFELLGIAPVAGRTAQAEEAVSGAARTAVVSAGFAATRLGASRDDPARALGTTLELDGVSYEVIGVLPERAGPLGARTQVFTTQQLEPPTRRGPFFQIVIGRLADGVDPDAAAAELGAINRRLFPLWRSSYQDEAATWTLAPLQELIHGDVERLVVLLAASVGLLLLLATMNAASLLLTRVRSRTRELAVREALGASRSRVIGHVLGESALLALAGTALGFLFAWGALALMPIVAEGYIPRIEELGLGGRGVAFGAFLAGATWLLFGLSPALRCSTGTRAAALGVAGARAGLAERSQRFLVALQVAVAVPLLFGGGLLASSLRNLERADPGFEPTGLLTAQVSLAAARYPDPGERQAHWWEVEERVAMIPGVSSVGVSDSRPPVEAFNYNNFDLEDRPTPTGESQPVACWVSADAGYLDALGVPLLEGRMLTRDDERPGADPVVVVDERWARRHFPGDRVVGRRLREGGATSGPWTTVVGVVGEVTYAGFGGDTGGTVYAPWTALTRAFVVVRAAGDEADIAGPLGAELRALDPTAPVTDMATGDALVESTLAQPRHLALLLLSFSMVALALAVVGIYGITAHAVESRRADIAVRVALGAGPGRVLGVVLRGALALSLLGLVVGTVAARGAVPLLRGLLYEVDPLDATSLSAVVALLAAVSLVACAMPAWRALRADPVEVLREQ